MADKPQYRAVYLQGISQPLLVSPNWSDADVDRYLQTDDARTRVAQMHGSQGVGSLLAGAGYSGLSQLAGLGLGQDRDAARSLQDSLQQRAQDTYTGPTSLEDTGRAYDQGGVGSGLGALTKTLGYNAVVPLTPVVAGTLAGGPWGGVAAGVGTQAPLMFGQNLQEQDQAHPDQPLQFGKALGATAGQMALETVQDRLMLGLPVGKTIAELATLPKASLTARVLGSAARTGGVAAISGATEAAQQGIQRAQAGEDLTSPEALGQYKENAGIGALLGGLMHSGSSALDSRHLNNQVEQYRAAETARAAQEQQAQATAQQAETARMAPWNAAQPGQTLDMFGAPAAAAPAVDVPPPIDMAAQLSAYAEQQRQNYVAQGLDSKAATKLAKADAKDQVRLVKQQATETPAPQQPELPLTPPPAPAEPPAPFQINPEQFPAAARHQQLQNLAQQNAGRIQAQTPDATALALTQGQTPAVRAQVAQDTYTAPRDMFGAPIQQEFRNGQDVQGLEGGNGPAQGQGAAAPIEAGPAPQEVAPQQQTLPFPVTEQPDLFGGTQNGQVGQTDQPGQTPGAEGLRGNPTETADNLGGAAGTGNAGQVQVGQQENPGLTNVIPLRGGQDARLGTGVRDQLGQLAQRNRVDVAAGRSFNEDNVAARGATARTLDKLSPKVESRMQDGADLPTALERLATDTQTGNEKLTDTEHALARSAYQRLTGKSLDRAIVDQLQAPQQGDLFGSGTVRTAKQTVDEHFSQRRDAQLNKEESTDDTAIEQSYKTAVAAQNDKFLADTMAPWFERMWPMYEKVKALRAAEVDRSAVSPMSVTDFTQALHNYTDAVGDKNSTRAVNNLREFMRTAAPKVETDFKRVLAHAQTYRNQLNMRKPEHRENAAQIDAILNNVSALPKEARQGESPDVGRARRLKESDIPQRGDNAAAWLGRTASEPWMREVAQKLKPYLKDAHVQTVDATDQIPAHVADALHYDGASGVTLMYPNGEVDIFMRRGGASMQEDILLHELVHGATEEAFAQLGKNHPLRHDMDAMRQYFFNTLQDSSHAPFFKQVMTSPEEFLAYAMSSPTFRDLAQVIPAYKGAPAKHTLWQRFVNWIRQLLGGAPRRTGDLLNAGNGKVFLNADAPNLYRQVDSMLQQVLNERGGTHDPLEGTMRIAQATQSVPLTDRVEQAKQIAKDTLADIPRVLDSVTNKYLDKGASVEKKLQASMNGAIRNGNVIRADLYMRQADDASQLARVVTETGKLTFNADGFAQVVPDDANVKNAAATLAAGADRLGITKEAARQQFTQYGIAYRMQDISNQIDKLNATLQQPGLKPAQVKAIKDTVKRLEGIITLSPNQIQEQLALAQTMPELEQTRATIRQAFRNATDAAFKAGSLTPEQYAQYQSTDGYIPFKRLLEKEETTEVGPKKYFRGLTSLPDLKQLKGSDLDINDLMGNTLMGIDEMTQRAVRNNAADKLANGLIDINEAEEIPASHRDYTDNAEQVITYLRNGKPVHVRLANPLDADAFRPTQNVSFPGLTTLRAMAQFLRASVVLQPDFALRQLIMDSANAGLMSGTQSPFKMTADVLKEGVKLIANEVRGKASTDPWVMNLRALGTTGRYDSVHVADPDVLRALNDAPTTAWGIVARKGRDMTHFFEKVASSAEFAQRVAIAKRTELETGDPVEAWHRAHEIINYSRRGSSPAANALLQTVPFMGAWSSATHLFLKTLQGRGLSNTDRVQAMKLLAGTVTKMAMASTLYAWMTEDDKRIQDRPVNERYKTFYVPLGDDTLLAMPVRPEAALLFKWIPERLWQLAKNNGLNDDGKMAWRDTKNAGLDALLFGAPVPAGVKPLIENYFNHSFFTGRPVVSDYMTDMPKAEQFNAGTSALAKALGDATNQSPIMLDNLLRGYTGPLMNYVNAVSFHLVNQFSDKPQPAKKFVEEPLIRSFFKDATNGSQNLNDFYDMLAQTEGVAKAYKRALDEGRIDDAGSLMADNKTDMLSKQSLAQLNTQLQGIGHAIKAISNGPGDSDSKRMQVDALKEMQKSLAASARQLRVRLDQ